MSFLESIENLGISQWVAGSPSKFAYPTVLLLHVIGMGVVAGLNGIMSLRLLGISPKLPIKPFESLYPLIWSSFWVNAATGVLLLMASATKRAIDPLFYIKLVFVFAGLAVMQRIKKQVLWKLNPDGEAPPAAKSLAWCNLICWLGAITAGRLLAYL